MILSPLRAATSRGFPLLVGRLIIFCGCLALSASVSADVTGKLEVPAGFEVTLVAGPRQVNYPMFAAFDESGRLFVAESSGLDLYEELRAQSRKCRVRLLEDHDRDGRFESSRVFADRLVFPMGLAWRSGKLYVADPPDLVALEDLDGDGTADTRTVILTGFGHRDNGSLHGLIFGPDGWLYMTMGSPDGYRLKRADGSLLEGESGALIRCRPDGSEPQVVCRGFENLVEIVFTPRGEVFGTDNWFQDVNKPGSNGLRDALVHLLEGGLYPYHREVGTAQPITGDPLSSVSLLPAVALSGLARYQGTTFPAKFHGNLFSAQHNARKIGRHVLVPDGSSFRSTDHDFLSCDEPDFRPSDVLEAADGSLLVIDTGSWYVQHCPTARFGRRDSRGGIYRVRWKDAAPPRDPWGNDEGYEGVSPERLLVLLGDQRWAVRERAHLALIARGEIAVPRLIQTLGQPGSATMKQSIIWTLAAMETGASRRALRGALEDSDDVAATAARALGLLGDRDAAMALGQLLSREAPQLRLAAAEALAHCGTGDSLALLWQALAAEPDRFLEHALIHAIHRLSNENDLQAALASDHPRLRSAALLLLAQPPRTPEDVPRDAVLACASATDARLRRTALRVLRQHPQWTDAAVDVVRAWLRTSAAPDEHGDELRDLVLALEAEPAMQELIAASLTDHQAVSKKWHIELLQILAHSKLHTPPPSWTTAIVSLIERRESAVRVEAVRTAAIWQSKDFEASLTRVVASDEEPTELRLEALAGVITYQPNLLPAVFDMLMGELAQDRDPLARLRAAELVGHSQLSGEQLTRLLQAVQGDSLIAPTVLLPLLQRSADAQTSAVLDYLEISLRKGWRPTEAQLHDVLGSLPIAGRRADLLELIKQNRQHQQADLINYESLLDDGDPHRGREVFFGSKVACATCHRLGEQGGNVGPDLTRIGAIRSGRDLVESIVVPSASIAQGYETYLVTTADGRVTSGILAHQTSDRLLLRDSSGALQRIGRADVETMDRQSVSLMPDGLPHAMTRDELRDLLAFLQTLR